MTRSTWASPALLIPMILIIVTVVARGVCRSMHIDPHDSAMAAALIANIVAAELAIIPLILTRGASQAAVVQASLVASVVQMFGAAALSGVALYAMHVGQPFVFWVIPLYWVALAVLVAGLISAIKRSSPLQTPQANH